jgi:hypothetical protein
MPKSVHIPTVSRFVGQLMAAEGHRRASMPEQGGWVVQRVLWDGTAVALVSWAYSGVEEDGTPSNLVENRSRSEEIRKIGEMLLKRGYVLRGFSERHNRFFVVPDGV